MKIPVVIAFDENYLQPTAVTISSLLINSNNNEYYEFICLHRQVPEASQNWLKKLRDKYGKCEFRFIDMKDAFINLPSLFHITSVTYFRLLIPSMFSEYDKILYADVDIVFQSGLSEVWNEDLGDNYLGGGMDYMTQTITDFIKERGLEDSMYINAGFLLLNTKKLREDNIEQQWLAEIGKPEHTIADQDIINKVCKDRIKLLPLRYNFFNTWAKTKKTLFAELSDDEFKQVLCKGTIHYVGDKPWRGNSVIYPKEYLWWGYYWRLPSAPQKRILKYYRVFVCKLPVVQFLYYKLRVGSILKRLKKIFFI